LAGKINIHAYSEGEQIYLNYSDTGRGMNPEVLEKLFEPFYTTKRGKGGTGLGMYICYNLVMTRLNGTLNCQSQVGAGTQFYINFLSNITN
jgi:signal transduction histidine kinase